VAGASGGGSALGGDVLQALQAAIASLESLVGGISGGGAPAGTPGQVAGDAGDGVQQIGQQPVQQSGVVQQVQHGHGHGSHGHARPGHGGNRGGKPGWGNGGSGPPGLLRMDDHRGTDTQTQTGPASGSQIDPSSYREVAAPEGAPTTDKSGAKIHYFIHPGDDTPRPLSDAMMKAYGIQLAAP
jgi:hypothetical protein